MGRIRNRSSFSVLGHRKQGISSPISSAAAVVFTTLPQAGPFAGLASTPISGLPNLTISADTSATGLLSSTDQLPLKYNVVTINNTRRFFAYVSDNQWQINLWCNTLILNGEISATGGDAGEAISGPNGMGGDGGNGASGGFPGQGNGGVCGCGGGTAGNPGISAWQIPPVYAFPNGGDGPGCNTGGPGRGGGGFGSGTNAGDPNDSGGGGGGGAGLVNVVCNTLTGSATSRLSANGGNFTLDSDSGLYDQTAGAGGVIWIAARAYNGLINPTRVTVTGYQPGSKTIQQINTNMSLTAKAFNQSWVAS